jgi:hypothetical protein
MVQNGNHVFASRGSVGAGFVRAFRFHKTFFVLERGHESPGLQSHASICNVFQSLSYRFITSDNVLPNFD